MHFYEQYNNISFQFLKFSSKYQNFPTTSFPNPHFPSLHVDAIEGCIYPAESLKISNEL